ncbi:MAG: CopG family antitoxin [Armatimonadota bacterium]|jgi:predicted DNA binding CopG/RHH family protein
MRKRKYLPEFRTEEEELEFWRTHRIDDYETEPANDIAWEIDREKSKRVTPRLEPSLIDELKQFAEEMQVHGQTLTRALIRRGMERVRKERRRAASHPQAEATT